MRLRIWLLCVITVTATLISTGCSGSGTRATAGDLGDSGVAAPAASDYLIGPGDTLNVFVWRNADLSLTVPVRPDGKISTPLVEDLQAVGKTPTQLARDIEVELEEFIRMPQVNVIVQSFVGTFAEQIRVVGQAAQPQALPYREGMTLIDVMIEVGGLTEFAAGNRSRVIRNEGGRDREIRVRLADLLSEGDMTQNVVMRPGDVVVVPGSVF